VRLAYRESLTGTKTFGSLGLRELFVVYHNLLVPLYLERTEFVPDLQVELGTLVFSPYDWGNYRSHWVHRKEMARIYRYQIRRRGTTSRIESTSEFENLTKRFLISTISSRSGSSRFNCRILQQKENIICLELERRNQDQRQLQSDRDQL
jgi:hypothetical protein